eukprot:jgi/Mesvir1/27330/Mv07146-RA.1
MRPSPGGVHDAIVIMMPSNVTRCLVPLPSCWRYCSLLPRAARRSALSSSIPRAASRRKDTWPITAQFTPTSRSFPRGGSYGPVEASGSTRCRIRHTSRSALTQSTSRGPLGTGGSIRCGLDTGSPHPPAASSRHPRGGQDDVSDDDTSIPAARAGASINRLREGDPLFSASIAITPGSDGASITPVARGAYVHVPFCRRRCHYCDFPIDTVGLREGSPRVRSRMETYVDTLCREIRATPAFLAPLPPGPGPGSVPPSGPHSSNARGQAQSSLKRNGTQGQGSGQGLLETVYFGGGTPSLLAPEQLCRILSALDDRFGVRFGEAEITCEMDPGTFDAAKLRAFLDMGVNRVSVGAQSFSPALLKATGRSHTLDDTLRALDLFRQAGVTNWSMDLISGLPGQTMELWVETLQAAIGHAPPHISVYDLQIEPGTAFGVWSRRGKLPLPSDELAADMFVATSQLLRGAGYEHYEVSNYARGPQFRSCHNQLYWRCAPYHAFGNGAASYTHGKRFSRPRGLPEYTDWVASYEASNGLLPGVPEETLEDRLLDRVMLSLRTRAGLDMRAVGMEFGEDVVRAILEATGERVVCGHAEYLDDGGHVIALRQELKDSSKNPDFSKKLLAEVAVLRLTDPHGLIVSNDIISSIFSVISDE